MKTETNKPSYEDLEQRVDDLVDFAIWMTGCGYDFCQHKYFCDKRDELLKGENDATEFKEEHNE